MTVVKTAMPALLGDFNEVGRACVSFIPTPLASTPLANSPVLV